MGVRVREAVAVEGRRIEVRGTVQGVGFRPWVYRLARGHGLAGRVRNDADGVTIEAFGPTAALDAFLRGIAETAPPAALIARLDWTRIPHEPAEEFIIVASRSSTQRHVSIPPDLATCPQCLREVFDPSDRRYRYPFTNCTNCGPRFTIAHDVPYDRAATTMAAFRMCPACRREYLGVTDRRFHAEPNACPACGPQLSLATPDGAPLAAADAIGAAAAALVGGHIVAVKGLGGFHLACDATSAPAVRRLRARKHRDDKPFAVMVADLAAAEALADCDDSERQLLQSVERPIVIVRRREPSCLAPTVAPRNPHLGLLLPYTPLHHLLLHAVGRPLVMTSGNLSEEPMACGNAEATARLGGIADLFLVHDREIETRCDDSVTRVVAGRPVVLRRARGYVPRGLPATPPFRHPVLACGAHLKNTVCLGVGDQAYLGPHIGDLDNVETYEAYGAAIAQMERFLATRPAVVAHDLHPDYLSTAYARSRDGVVLVGVQHHHAHVASAMAEHGLHGPVVGVAYDGTGYGMDGTAWGGEVLVADRAGFERVATFRPLRLAGGDQAIRQVWRSAVALLDDAFDGTPPLDVAAWLGATARATPVPPTRVRDASAGDMGVRDADLRVVRQMIVAGVNAPWAHGVGRYFDAVGALVLRRTVARHEGQVAMELEFAADPAVVSRYPFDIDWRRTPWVVDLRGLVRAVVADLAAGVPPGTIAAQFHNTLVAATAVLVRAAAVLSGCREVVLTGGCFQNVRLAEGIASALAGNLCVYLHHDVPPGDGGIALGQAVVADAVTRRRGW